MCDPTTGKIKIPSAPRVGVHEGSGRTGDSNGGATYQGVTKDTVKVVVCVPPRQTPAQPARRRPAADEPERPGRSALIEDAVLDAQQALDGRYELWGRKIEYTFVTYSGTDESAQRADAVKVAQMKPFAVINTSCGPVFSTEIATRKIVVPFGAGNQKANLAQQPYRYTGQDANLQAQNVATWLGNQIAGQKARFAGDPDFQKQTRKFGVVYTTTAGSGSEIDIDNFKPATHQARRAQARGRGGVDRARRRVERGIRRRPRRSRHRCSSRS